MTGPAPQGMAAVAANSGTDPETLRQIAYHYPELRPVVAANPAAYEGLLDWLAQLGDPAVDAALAARRAHDAGAVAVTRTTLDGVLGDSAGAGATSGAQGGSTQDTDEGGAPWQASTPAGGGAPVVGGAPVGADTSATSTMKAVAIGLAALAVLLLAACIFILNGGFGLLEKNGSTPGAQSTQSTQSAAQEEAESTPAASAAEDTQSEAAQSDADEVRYPAPDGALDLAAIASPSGNIVCHLTDGHVECEIGQHSWPASAGARCGDQSALGVLTATDTSASAQCRTGAFSSQGTTVLDYGASTAVGDTACTSTENGMLCWNTRSGTSFLIARESWATGTQGPTSVQ